MNKPIIIELPENQARRLYSLSEALGFAATYSADREFWSTISRAIEQGMYNKDKHFHQCSSCFEPTPEETP